MMLLLDVLEKGFLIFRRRWTLSFLLSFLGVGCLTLTIFFKTQFIFNAPIYSWLISLLGMILSQVFFGALIFLLYASHKNLSCSFLKALWIGAEKLPILIITLLIYSLMIFIGTVAFIFPGIILSILWVFAFILIYTDNHDPMLALTTSFTLCKNHFFSVSVILFTIGLLICLGNLIGLALGYVLFISLLLNSNELLICNLMILSLINGLLIPIVYTIMISLLNELKSKITC